MIALADRNLLRRPQLKNVEFRLGSITALPVSDASVDCAISNCVLNLVPAEEKQQAMREIARVLKSGGRVAISDLLAKASMPDEVKKDIGALVGCISGTVTVDHMTALLREAGFQGELSEQRAGWLHDLYLSCRYRYRTDRRGHQCIQG